MNEITFDPNEVQICKPFSSVNKRIDYFLKRKHEENIDRTNRLYCSSVSKSKIGGSSRTCDTIAVKRQKGSECFVEKTKVCNTSGPQNNGGVDPVSENSCFLLSDNFSNVGAKPDLQERVSNLERCLNICSDDHSTIDVYKRLKSIEDRVLKLEDILLNIDGNLSLSNILSTDQYQEILNKNSKMNNIGSQERDTKSAPLDVLHKKSKYSAIDIQNLIDDLKRIEEKKNVYESDYDSY